MAKWEAWGDHPVYVTLSVIAALVTIVVAIPAMCQSAETRGVVRDLKTGKPIARAKITFQFKDFSRPVYTDNEGVYHLPIRPEAYGEEGSIVVEKDGYEVYKRHVAIDRILEEIFLTPVSPPKEGKGASSGALSRPQTTEEQDGVLADFYGCTRESRETFQCAVKFTNQTTKIRTIQIVNADLNEESRGLYPARTIQGNNRRTTIVRGVESGESATFQISFRVNPGDEDFNKIVIRLNGGTRFTFWLQENSETGNSTGHGKGLRF